MKKYLEIKEKEKIIIKNKIIFKLSIIIII